MYYMCNDKLCGYEMDIDVFWIDTLGDFISAN